MDDLGKRLLRNRDEIAEKLARAERLESEAWKLRKEAEEIKRCSELARQS